MRAWFQDGISHPAAKPERMGQVHYARLVSRRYLTSGGEAGADGSSSSCALGLRRYLTSGGEAGADVSSSSMTVKLLNSAAGYSTLLSAMIFLYTCRACS